MTVFLRLLADRDKASNLVASCAALRAGASDARVFEVNPESFRGVPGAPFAYWVSERVRELFSRLSRFESDTRMVRQGGVTGNDERFLRLWWETSSSHATNGNWSWKPFAKGGSVSRWYSDIATVVVWDSARGTFGGYTGLLHRPSEKPSSAEHYFKGGLTWPLRAGHFAPVPLPRECVFSIRGYAILAEPSELLPLAALCNSAPFDYIFKVALGRFGFPEFVVGVLQHLPIPELTSNSRNMLSKLMSRAWLLKRQLDTVEETSHAFVLPASLRRRLGDYEPPAIEAELSRIHTEIDAIGFDLYGFSEIDRAAVQASAAEAVDVDAENEADEDGDIGDDKARVDEADGLNSWAVGVAFGRFDWRLAIGEREAPQDPGPFDPLPSVSAGMLPRKAERFHPHHGILVDEVGHPRDLVRLMEEVLTKVKVPVPGDLRRWLQRDFFPFHLQSYSKSRRKAPIYWPLSTASGSYTLWIYYPSLTSQTLYTAVNDFLDGPSGKLAQVSALVANLRSKGSSRSRDDERQFEALQAFELELLELRDILLNLAPTYKPSHDDGVQISAAPLWPLFRYKPWQKLLKDTWANLERGEYDWAHLAMNYWPDRVRKRCITDKSLAIAHGLESLYVEPEVTPKKTRGKKKGAEA